MDVLNLIKNKTLIITNNSYKKKLLDEINNSKKLYNIKFMTIEDYKKNLLFDYDLKTINYLVSNYYMKVSNAITLINNLYYIENKKYQSDKLNYLVSIKNELDDHNLLIYNRYFKKYLNDVDLIVYGYNELDKFSLSLLKNALFVNDECLSKKIDIYEFNNISEEVEFIFNEISELLIKGISLDNIKLMNVTSEYIPYLKRFSNYYNIPINLPNESIYGTKIVNEFLMLIKDNYSKDEILKKLDEYKDNNIYNVLISLMNKYIEYEDLNNVYELILYDIKNTKTSKKNYRNIIELVDINDYIDDSYYVFLLGFNNGNIPVLYKDENYITDNIKDEIIMSNTDDLNRISNLNTINALKRINNLFISYKLKTPFNTYFPSNLIDELDCEIHKENHNSFNYSTDYNKMKYTTYLDEYVKYGSYNNDLEILYNSYGKMNYSTYDNTYKIINKESLLEYLDNKLTLSYSSIDNFYKCSFRYYLTNILKIDLYEESFDTIIGNIFHYVLSKAFNDNFNFEKEFNTAIKDYNFNNMENFFLNKLKEDLEFIIETIKEYRINTGLTDELYEQKILIPLKDNPSIEFKGFIDKIMYKEKDNNNYLAIIDYKTGNPSIKLDYLKYGLSMQLPSYLYLTSKSNLFNNIKYCGFYLQHILDNEIKIDSKKSFLEQKKDNLKLQGYTTDDLNRLSMFDASYENSVMIKGIKTKVDGELTASAKVLSDIEINEIINLCEEKINEAVKDILNGDFSINPKVIKDENIGCKYCHFKDICYYKEKDKVYLEESEVE